MKYVFAAGIAFAAMAGNSGQAAPVVPLAIVEYNAESSSLTQKVYGRGCRGFNCGCSGIYSCRYRRYRSLGWRRNR